MAVPARRSCCVVPPCRGGTSSTSLLVSILIYELLLLIRGTRAVQMALSAGFLIGLFFVSRWFDLETVNWVIRNLATYVGFAIIVLFQADIRRALAHFGRAPFFKYFERATSADETHRGSRGRGFHAGGAPHRRDHRHRAPDWPAELHRRRHSARRHDHLRPARDDFPARLAAARRRRDRAGRSHCCGRVFPAALDQSDASAASSAPRHRAALGITEENDAVAIVVSEETGAISRRACRCTRARAHAGAAARSAASAADGSSV